MNVANSGHKYLVLSSSTFSSMVLNAFLESTSSKILFHLSAYKPGDLEPPLVFNTKLLPALHQYFCISLDVHIVFLQT